MNQKSKVQAYDYVIHVLIQDLTIRSLSSVNYDDLID